MDLDAKMQMQKCKTWSRCICIVQKMHLHDVIAGIKRFILSPRLRASVYALGSDMKIDGGTFPNSSVGDCFLPHLHSTTSCSAHSAAPPPAACLPPGEYACWVPYQSPLRYPLPPSQPPKKPCWTGHSKWWDIA